MATFYAAQVYFLDDDLEHAWSYADRASVLSRDLADPDTIAHSTNLAGTLSLRRSCFDDAEHHYQAALELMQELEGYHEVYCSLAKENLGYVMMCTDRIDEGIALCEEARRELESLDAEFALHEVFQDLCYGHILADHLDRAEECGQRAFSLASEISDHLIVKNSLFLLAEISVRRGNTFMARRYLRELTEYYPEIGVSEEIIEVFLTTDLTQVVNLRG
jgi:tetratricopeptide (TPR) repeat protein